MNLRVGDPHVLLGRQVVGFNGFGFTGFLELAESAKHAVELFHPSLYLHEQLMSLARLSPPPTACADR